MTVRTTLKALFTRFKLFSQKPPSICFIQSNNDFSSRRISVDTTHAPGEPSVTVGQLRTVLRSITILNSLTLDQKELSTSHRVFNVVNFCNPSPITAEVEFDPGLTIIPLIELTRPLRMRSNSFEPTSNSA